MASKDLEVRPTPKDHLKHDIDFAIERIRTDIETPSLNKALKKGKRNRCAEQIANEILTKEFRTMYADKDTIGNFIILEAEKIMSTGLIDMIYAYQISEREPIPDDDGDFFNKIKTYPNWKLRQQNLTLSQVNDGQRIIYNEKQKSEIKLSPLWVFTRLLSLAFTAEKIEGRLFYEEIVKSFQKKGLKLLAEDGIQETLSQITKTYISPQICLSLLEIDHKITKNMSL